MWGRRSWDEPLKVACDTPAIGCVQVDLDPVVRRRTQDILPLASSIARMVRGPITIRRVRGFLETEYDLAFRHDHWNIGIADVPIHAFLDPTVAPMVHWMPPPGPGKFYADPFGVTKAGETEILFEEYDFRSDKGVISSVHENADGRFSQPRPAIEFPFHTAYPYLIERDDSLFCIPETAKGKEVAIFRADEFPLRWTKAAVLVPGVAGLDSTVFEHDGRFWLFCTDQNDGPISKLRVWYAPDLFGPWTAHPLNPVKTDAASARPAGTPFRFRGELYRPSQDCTNGYGGGVTINRVVRLTPTDFCEEAVAKVGPFGHGPSGSGIHTLSALGNRTLVDGKWSAFNPSEMARRMREAVDDRWPLLLRGR